MNAVQLAIVVVGRLHLGAVVRRGSARARRRQAAAQRLEMLTSFYEHPGRDARELADRRADRRCAVRPFACRRRLLYAAHRARRVFYHANRRTPHCVGYVFQRPEMHRIHHEYGWHRGDYGGIVWRDMLFGTYDNPRSWEGRCGFDAQREERLAEMLAFRDVHDDRP
jgi:hypothetical protein